MSDLKKYIAKRKESDSEFAKDFDDGYQAFKIGAVLKSVIQDTHLLRIVIFI